MAEIEITGALLDEVEAKAGVATQQPWQLFASFDACPHQVFLRRGIGSINIQHYGYDDPDGQIKREQLANAKHIARMDPPTALALVAEVRRLTAENAKAREYLSATAADLAGSLNILLNEAPEGLFAKTAGSLAETISALERASRGLDISSEYEAEITKAMRRTREARRQALEDAANMVERMASTTPAPGGDGFGTVIVREVYPHQVAAAIRALKDKEAAHG